MKTLHTAFFIAVIRAIRAIRGKNLRETERLWQIAARKVFCLCSAISESYAFLARFFRLFLLLFNFFGCG
jgi:hypothetical protein